jgi:hypothetical protein
VAGGAAVAAAGAVSPLGNVSMSRPSRSSFIPPRRQGEQCKPEV